MMINNSVRAGVRAGVWVRSAGRVCGLALLAGVLSFSLAACGDGTDFEGVTGGGDPNPAPGSGDDADDANDAPDAADGDAVQQARECLIGEWNIDRSSDLWDVPAGDADKVSGNIVAAFSGEHDFELRFDRWYIYYDNGAEVDSFIEATWDGVISGEYAIDTGGIATVNVVDSTATIETLTSFVGGVEEDTQRAEDAPLPVIFTCEGDQLVGFLGSDSDRAEPYAIFDR
ncbi:hypothetical protein [Microbacterium sp. YY-01]|uniref:hypothetical protein n=1 Tax=Microbacterium sp. YY-01 TaxID=3421634 RepID=UPI003D17D249